MAATHSKTASETKRGYQEGDETLVSLKFVKELLEQQQSTMKTFISAFMDSVNVRVDSLIKDVASFRTSLEFTQGQVDELIKAELDVKRIKSNIEHLEEKIDDLENRSRRNNLCFEGIEESTNETWQDTENKVKHLITSHMPEVGGDIVIERAHRVGKPRSSAESKPRKIVARFLNYKDRESVLKAKKKLRGTNVFVNEDYSDRVMKKRMDLMPELKEARRRNQRAFLRYDKLIIYENAGSTTQPSDHPTTEDNGSGQEAPAQP